LEALSREKNVALVFDKQPSLFVYLTDRCNLSCRHCSQDASARKTRLISLRDIEKIVSFGKEYGCTYVGLSGGEPTLHPNFFKIAAYFISNGIDVNIVTNGTGINKNSIGRYEDLIKSVTVSLDGFSENHYFIRRLDLYRQTIDRIELISKSNINLRIQTTVFKRNYNQIDEFVSFVTQYSPERINLNPLIYKGRARWLDEQFLDSDQIDRLVKKIIEFNIMHVACKIHTTAFPIMTIFHNPEKFHIYPNESENYPAIGTLIFLCNGDILPCHSSTPLRYKLGNLKEDKPLARMIQNFTNNSRHRQLLSEVRQLYFRIKDYPRDKTVHWINEYIRQLSGAP
jgi:MoaA/NifB/PqqE/SkfB family radical SAM enzyme